MTIRNAEPRDASVIADFNRAMAKETEGLILDPDKAESGVRAVLEDPSLGFYLVAEMDGRIVGQMMITFEWSDWRNATFWWLQSVYVEPGRRRRGVFRELYETVRQRARADVGICGLRLYVESGNEGAQRTYEMLGMVRTPYRMYEADCSDGAHALARDAG